MTIRPLKTQLQDKVESVVAQLEVGEVVSFGDVAERAGYPGASRAAGSTLAKSVDLPWWRVVYSDGQLPPCNPGLQAERLIQEGVSLQGFRVIASPAGRFANK